MSRCSREILHRDRNKTCVLLLTGTTHKVAQLLRENKLRTGSMNFLQTKPNITCCGCSLFLLIEIRIEIILFLQTDKLTCTVWSCVHISKAA